MSNFLYHEPCDCGSSDGRGVWDDGHKWCFVCRKKWEGDLSLDEIERRLTTITEVSNSKNIPDDFTYSIPVEPYRWLKSYQLTNAEIINHHIGWSNMRQMLIFPYYGEDNEIIFWQGRYFPKRPQKCFSVGDISNNLVLVNSTSSNFAKSVVVVEDPVSAIKVARVATALPLFGSHLSLLKATRLAKFYETLILWLDEDKTSDMIKFQQQYSYLYQNVKVVTTKLDPKCYNEKEIEEFLND